MQTTLHIKVQTINKITKNAEGKYKCTTTL